MKKNGKCYRISNGAFFSSVEINRMLHFAVFAYASAQFFESRLNSLSGECKSVIAVQGPQLNANCFPKFDFQNVPQRQQDWINRYQEMIPSICSESCLEQVRKFTSFVDFACDKEVLFKDSNLTALDFGNINLLAAGASCSKTTSNQYCIVEQARMSRALGIEENFGLEATMNRIIVMVNSNQTKPSLLCSECVQNQLNTIKKNGGLTARYSTMIRSLDSQFQAQCASKQLAKGAGSNGFRVSLGWWIVGLWILL
jgi:hypothetical protein